jgi:antitoxin HicB
MFKYSVTIRWSDEDKGFIATVPELPGLSAFGEAQEDAISEIQIAGEAYLEALRETGQRTPTVEKVSPYSGQLRVRMLKSLHAQLAAAAEREEVSLNTYIVSLLSARHAEAEALRTMNLGTGHPQAWEPNSNAETTKVTLQDGPAKVFPLKSSTHTVGRRSNG